MKYYYVVFKRARDKDDEQKALTCNYYVDIKGAKRELKEALESQIDDELVFGIREIEKT